MPYVLAKARTLLKLASSLRGAIFRLILFVKSKSKSNYEFASLIRLYARFARSRFKYGVVALLGQYLQKYKCQVVIRGKTNRIFIVLNHS